jgi:mono/diheme cytochrome c family protein
VAAGAAVVAATCAFLGAAAAEPQPDGRAIFAGKGNCWVCHGRDGRGTALAPNLADAEWLNGDGTLQAVTEIVRSGVPRPKRFPGMMPPGGGASLNDAEVRAVAAYVVSLSGGND